MRPEDLYYVIASFALPISAAWALYQWHRSVNQRKDELRWRKDELRWRKAEAAWRLLDKVFEDPESLIALELIDDERDVIDIPDLGRVKVSRDDALKALDPNDCSPASRIIRYSLNCLLYAFDRLEGAVASGYVLEEDVRSPTAYYSKRLYALWPRLEPYARDVGYRRSLALIERLARS